MQNKMMQMFSSIGLMALEKSRAYYFPPTTPALEGGEILSDAEFANMLQEIDRFSAQFPLPSNKIEMGISNRKLRVR